MSTPSLSRRAARAAGLTLLTTVLLAACGPMPATDDDRAAPDARTDAVDARDAAVVAVDAVDPSDAALPPGGDDAGSPDTDTDSGGGDDDGGVPSAGDDAAVPMDDAGARDAGGHGHVSSILVPEHGAWLGSTNDRLAEIEHEIGRSYDIVHTYHGWHEAFPTDAERTLSDGGRFLLLDWDAADSGTFVSWAQIADGAQDAVIDAAAARFRAFGRPFFLNFNHEPEADDGAHNGPASDFVLAWRHIYARLHADGATNVVYTWIVMGWNPSSFPAFYPGDAYVDWIGWDPYNWFGCTGHPGADTWRSFQQIVQPFYDWATTNHPGKPLMLGEYGTNEDPSQPTRKADWFTQSLSDLETRFPALRATVYFNQGPPHFFARWVDTSTASTAAYRRIAQDPYYNPPHR